MKGKFVGVKRVTGTSKKTNQPFDIRIACIVTDMSERDVNNGARGEDVHSVSVPDEFKELLSESNVGKTGDFTFFYSNGSERLAYATINAK